MILSQTEIFLGVFLAAASVPLIAARMIRGITFFGTNTDNQKQIYTAAKIDEWRWPSDMHKYVDGGVRTRMKDVAILGLALMQRLLRDRTTDFPIVMLCMVANSASAVLIFLICEAYWNTTVALLLGILFLTAFWPYQVALYGGYHCVSQVFFLAGVYFLLQIDPASFRYSVVWLWLGGACAGLMLFSSSASRKFLPLFVAAFLYSQRSRFSIVSWGETTGNFIVDSSNIFFGLLFLPSIALFFVRLYYKPIVQTIYSGGAPYWLSNMISARQRQSLEYYLQQASRHAPSLGQVAVGLAVWFLLNLILTRSASFYFSQVVLALGGISVVLFLTYPNVAGHLWSYYFHSQWGKEHNHFSSYVSYFSKSGKPIGDKMRGAGIQWIFRLLLRMAPSHAIFWLVSLCLLAYLHVVNEFRVIELMTSIAIVILSVSPLLVGELTRGQQIGRSYFPGLVGLLLLIGYAAFKFAEFLDGGTEFFFWSSVAAATLASASWNVCIFINDVLPARMAPAWLGKTLDELGLTEFYTYDTPYNNAFVGALLASKDSYKVHSIQSLAEVAKGYIIVPGTSAKAVNMESECCAIEDGDFSMDPDLNRLIESKEIVNVAVACFKTFGTSRVWVNESEVTSYRDLILKEISHEDRWRGHGWILDAGRLPYRKGNASPICPVSGEPTRCSLT